MQRSILPAPRILLTAFDWGLGHASRSVVLARAFADLGCRVELASSGRALDLWRNDLPDLPWHQLSAYGVRLAGRGAGCDLLLQLPQLWQAARQEHRWLRTYVQNNSPDLIVSDCRFGCFHPTVPSVLVTHQLRLPVTFPVSVPTTAVYRWLLRQYREVWIPDLAAPPRLAGRLSQDLAAYPTTYLGPLSRFQPVDSSTQQQNILILLSGPEPQRSRLEELLLRQIGTTDASITLVRGVPATGQPPRHRSNLTIIDAVYGHDLHRHLAQATCIVCRSGYSTLMDVAAVGRPAILIPTPGQPEQGYLARYWQERGWAHAYAQNGFHWAQALTHFSSHPPSSPVPKTPSLKTILAARIQALTGLNL